jgi:ribosome maturation factor RimP
MMNFKQVGEAFQKGRRNIIYLCLEISSPGVINPTNSSHTLK